METSANFMNVLPADITSLVMQKLYDPADVVRAAAISPAWRHFIFANGIFKKMWMRKFPSVYNISYGNDNNESTMLSDIASSNAVNWDALEKEHRIFCSLLQPLSGSSISFSEDILRYAIGASSTYNKQITNIKHTLTPVDRNSCGNTGFWSSEGVTNPDVPEHLLYRLRNRMCVVSQIELQPFDEAILEPGKHVYSPISVRFRMGCPKPMKDVQELGNDLSPDHYVWAYTSPVYPVKQEASLQQFKLPEPVVCLGGVVMVELIGRAQKNEADGLYYIRMGYVRVIGYPLDPEYMLQVLDSGELYMNYLPRTSRCFISSVIQQRILETYASLRMTRRYIRPRVDEDAWGLSEEMWVWGPQE